MPEMPALPGLLPALWEGFMLAVVCRSGQIQQVNPHLARALGFDALALQGRPLSSIAPEGAQGFNPTEVLDFLAHSRCWLGKLALRKADGGILLVQVTMVPLQDAQEQSDRVLLLATSTVRTQDFPVLVADTQERFHAMLEGLAAPVLLHAEGRIVYANQAMLSLSGYTLAALQAMPYEQLTHPDHRDALRQRVEARLRGDASRSRFENVLLDASGAVCWVDQTMGLLPVDGTPALLDTFVDLTVQRQGEARQAHALQMLAQIVEGNPVPTLVLNAQHEVTHWNRALEQVSSLPASEVVGTRDQWKAFYPSPRPVLADLIVDGAGDAQVSQHYEDRFKRSEVIPDAWQAEGFFPDAGRNGMWFVFTASPLRDAQGQVVGAIETLVDVTQRKRIELDLQRAHDELEHQVQERTAQLASANQQLALDNTQRREAEAELLERNAALEQLNQRLTQAQQQLVQSEKLASIGQLAAGVAHEINNPIGYVHSNIGSLERYIGDLFKTLEVYEKIARDAVAPEGNLAALEAARSACDVDFLKEDIPALVGECKEGITRVKKIVQDLKDFSRVDSSQEWQTADLHHGIDSTLNIVNNEIKYKADVVKEYGALPPVECLPSQLNQVFMNLLVNAAHAMGEARGRITIRTGTLGDRVWLEFGDNGSGIPPELQQKIFDPFFTTKPVGKGTGLGLSLSYGIIQKHHGVLSVHSEVGKGTVFRIELPTLQPKESQEKEDADVRNG